MDSVFSGPESRPIYVLRETVMDRLCPAPPVAPEIAAEQAAARIIQAMRAS